LEVSGGDKNFEYHRTFPNFDARIFHKLDYLAGPKVQAGGVITSENFSLSAGDGPRTPEEKCLKDQDLNHPKTNPTYSLYI
jgi:hypothetical protein